MAGRSANRHAHAAHIVCLSASFYGADTRTPNGLLAMRGHRVSTVSAMWDAKPTACPDATIRDRQAVCWVRSGPSMLTPPPPPDKRRAGRYADIKVTASIETTSTGMPSPVGAMQGAANVYTSRMPADAARRQAQGRRRARHDAWWSAARRQGGRSQRLDARRDGTSDVNVLMGRMFGFPIVTLQAVIQ